MKAAWGVAGAPGPLDVEGCFNVRDAGRMVDVERSSGCAPTSSSAPTIRPAPTRNRAGPPSPPSTCGRRRRPPQPAPDRARPGFTAARRSPTTSPSSIASSTSTNPADHRAGRDDIDAAVRGHGPAAGRGPAWTAAVGEVVAAQTSSKGEPCSCTARPARTAPGCSWRSSRPPSASPSTPSSRSTPAWFGTSRSAATSPGDARTTRCPATPQGPDLA